MEKETLSSQHQLELKGHVTKMAAVSSQLITLQQRADKQELTIAGLKASLTAKELEESEKGVGHVQKRTKDGAEGEGRREEVGQKRAGIHQEGERGESLYR